MAEQQTHQSKKKKRPSGGSNLNTPNPNTGKSTGQSVSPLQGPATSNGSPPPKFPSAQRSRSKTMQQAAARPTYASAATQTDLDDGEVEMPPQKRRKFVTPTQRLLRKVFADRARYEQQCKMGLSPPGPGLMSMGAGDTEMKDVASGLSPVSVKSLPLPSPSSSSEANTTTSPMQSPLYPLPSQVAHSHKQFKVPAAPKLQLTTMPAVPNFPSAGNWSTPSTTPTITTPLTVLSPPIASGLNLFPPTSHTMTPSPAKKKMSLGDYMSRRNTNSGTTPSAEKSSSQNEGSRKGSDASVTTPQETVPRAKPDDAVKQQAAAQGGLEGSAIDDTVMKDEMEEPEYSPPEPAETNSDTPHAESDLPTTLPNTTQNVSPEVTNILAMLSQLRQTAGSS